jgi:hypothetical protein
MTKTMAGLLVLALAGCGVAEGGGAEVGQAEDALSQGNGAPEVVPNGHGFVTREAAGAAKPGTSGIFFHGGPVMTATKNVYFIWWGQWGSDTARTILPDEVAAMGGTPWFNINSTYYDSAGVAVSNATAVAGQITDTSLALGATITDSDVTNEVNAVLNAGLLPRDPAGVYLVLTPADVNDASGFCTRWCGWHSFLNNSIAIKYAYIPNAARCPSACSPVTSGPTPNGNLGADAMASIIAHELAEAATDPQLNAWYDRRGYENADKCAWTFGTTSTDANGARYNVQWGSRFFLIQRNWVNSGGGFCALAYP